MRGRRGRKGDAVRCPKVTVKNALCLRDRVFFLIANGVTWRNDDDSSHMWVSVGREREREREMGEGGEL